MREVKSPSSRERGVFHPRLAESPGSRSSPSNAADSGHLVPSPGKGGGPAVRRDSMPVVGGQRNVIEDR